MTPEYFKHIMAYDGFTGDASGACLLEGLLILKRIAGSSNIATAIKNGALITLTLAKICESANIKTTDVEKLNNLGWTIEDDTLIYRM